MAKPAVILVLLVALPTAALSFLSGRALRNWESTLRTRFETGATRALREVSDRLHGRLETEWWRAHAAVEAALAPRGNWADIDKAAAGLEDSSVLIERLYVFLDPLGLVYRGASAPETARPGETAREERLNTELRDMAASMTAADPATRARAIRLESDLYCFGPLRGGRGLFVGYRVRESGFREILDAALADLAGGDFILLARPVADAGTEVIVADSFSPARHDASPLPRHRDGPGIMAALAPPLDFVTITAQARDPGQMARAAAWRFRLHVWGIILLSLAVIGGGALILRQAAAEGREVREQRDLVMGVSHDLRTPVASMKMMAESLYHGHVRDPARRREFIGTLIAESDRLADMIERVIMLLRQDRKALSYQLEPLDIVDLARAAIDVYRERMAATESRDARERVRLSAASRIPPVRGDRRALTAVLTNLLDNALTHGAPLADTPLELPAVAVEITPAKRRGRPCVRVAVRDFGRGIPRRETGRIFRRFYRIRGTDGAPPGVGLGLALCRDILKAHGGAIKVRGRIDRGSEFSFYLRAAPGHAYAREDCPFDGDNAHANQEKT